LKRSKPILRIIKESDGSADGSSVEVHGRKNPAEKKSISPVNRNPSNDAINRRVNDPLERYLAEIRRYTVLTREEEKKLTRAYYQSSDPKLAVKLISSNLRLVVKIALEYKSPWSDLLDLIQEGNLGMLQAIRKFDPEREIRLSSYAQWWIRAYILKYLMDNHRLVKVGTTQAQRKLFYNLKKERERLERQGFKPTPKLLAKALKVRVQDIVSMESRLSSHDMSIDLPVMEGQRERLVDFLPADVPDIEEALVKKQISQKLLMLLDTFQQSLTGRELEIWNRRMLSEEPVTLQALGNAFGVSRERARQLEARVMKRLKEYLGEESHLIEHLSFPIFQ
jgi:RNA polymerase sigma-32 factor